LLQLLLQQVMTPSKFQGTLCWGHHRVTRVVVPILCIITTMGSINFVRAFHMGVQSLSHKQRLHHEEDTNKTRRTSRLFSEVKFKNFDHVLNSFHEEILLIYFGTRKCGPCQLMKKELEVAKKRLLGRREQGQPHPITIFSLDTEKWPHLGTRYGIQRLPCILVVRDGVIRKRLEGLTKADVIVKEIDELI
jgi:thioredoxin-like negative regulator of GroEL